jgi:hypothetical protein
MDREAPRPISPLPRGPGVYRSRAADGAVLCIGRTTTLRGRVEAVARLAATPAGWACFARRNAELAPARRNTELAAVLSD